MNNPNGKPVKILVVDDQSAVRLTLGTILQRMGYEVQTVQDGFQAVEQAKQGDYQLIFMDVKMPGMDGVEAFARIKQVNPKATVIMMTGFALEEQIRRAIQEGAYAVVYKPFEIDKITGIIRECLEGKPMLLLMDDVPEHGRKLKEDLTRRGYSVVEAGDGLECVRLVQEKRFDVILMEVEAAPAQNMETVLKVREVRPDVAIILLTAESMDGALEDAVRNNSYACIYQPFDVEKVVKTVDQCLKKNPA